jgi:ribonuclease J
VVEIIIHRGANRIGGNCFEIKNNKQRIIIDLGFPLMDDGGGDLDEIALQEPSIKNSILPDIEGIYHFQKPTVCAIILSHPHLDHFGLMDFIHPDIPIYISQAAQRLVEISAQFSPQEIILKNMVNFSPNHPFMIDEFRVTPIKVDHSSFDSLSLLIEVSGKKILYSGDIRRHGRKDMLFQSLISRNWNGIDCLVLEGTTVGGSKRECTTEYDVEVRLQELFSSQSDTSFVIAAGSNIDRVISLYNSAYNSKKILVLDPYAVFLLDQLKVYDPTLPQYYWKGIRVFYVPRHAQVLEKYYGRKMMFKFKSKKISYPEIIQNRKDLVIKVSMSGMSRIADQLNTNSQIVDGNFVFSMWAGYLDKQPEFNSFREKYDLQLEKIHTSGHASIEDLQELTSSIQPKAVIPIHTLAPNLYSQYFDNILLLQDGEPYTV